MARSKEFDEKAVLRKAMELFWEQGYEKTSMQDLVDHMGIHRRSIYDTFGDKRSLFLASLNHYEELIVNEMERIISSTSSIKQTIRDVFIFVLNSIEQYPKGCLSVNAAIELSLLDKEIGRIVTKMFNRTEDMFNNLIKRGQTSGELSKEIDSDNTSRFLHNNLVGIRVLIKTNYNKKELEGIITLALSVLD
ncbi:TetR family transcriptional regulator [Bacillus sp. Soil745]|jgi:TetR/AcrR family transcriptional repressor of nem operon|uniref:TetR/AcrR family transcriptional regulator n=1 Tax=Bacillaceae TaxID=186817 RepID=UPI000708E699|nr:MULTISPECIES: TetR/AcrR family transcriptional regulator [Bacillaceae]KRF47823.1 TetR family transcriptional regulator [Bacillus sp. Soil745]PAW26637.1 TetR family transcriptional regulator [Peribacillus simplex]PEO46637.1 TetR/AcrR family transcriptional regulator [Bacillus sp. AFS026049]PHD73542.1 TetR/AcrR family transcriptional regulator [Bacillus sp. AFS043905]PRS26176.1 TetR/AcrR family transcriptional regulator [Bacillus sp. RJGP41]QNK48976.1 TetR/AcrR family transcriptional regulat